MLSPQTLRVLRLTFLINGMQYAIEEAAFINRHLVSDKSFDYVTNNDASYKFSTN